MAGSIDSCGDQRRIFTARAATTAIVTNDTIDSVVNSAFMRNVSGMASAGAKLVPFAKDV